MRHLIIIGLGGFIGTIARFGVSKLSVHWQFLSIPMGTLLVNVLGSLIIGILMGLSQKTNLLSLELRMFLIIGICGGFTTFSSFSSENLVLMQNGQFLIALIYTASSILFGFTAVYLGYLAVSVY